MSLEPFCSDVPFLFWFDFLAFCLGFLLVLFFLCPFLHPLPQVNNVQVTKCSGLEWPTSGPTSTVNFRSQAANKSMLLLAVFVPVWGLYIQFMKKTSKIQDSPHCLMQCKACVLPLCLSSGSKVSDPTTAGLVLWEWSGHSAFMSSLTLNCWSEINIVWFWEHSSMTVKIELHAASTKRSDTYSPGLCALSFMICLTGWESVFCKVSLLKCVWSSKARTVTLYTEAGKHLLWFEVTTSSVGVCSSCGFVSSWYCGTHNCT